MVACGLASQFSGGKSGRAGAVLDEVVVDGISVVRERGPGDSGGQALPMLFKRLVGAEEEKDLFGSSSYLSMLRIHAFVDRGYTGPQLLTFADKVPGLRLTGTVHKWYC